jgi:hypothetical protein
LGLHFTDGRLSILGGAENARIGWERWLGALDRSKIYGCSESASMNRKEWIRTAVIIGLLGLAIFLAQSNQN